MKKKTLLAAAVLAALAVPQVAGAEGFGIVQWSAEGVAMGGARMFAENDVSMVAANPASLTKYDGKGMGINATYISPHGKYDIKAFDPSKAFYNESGKNRIHPGIVPGSYYVKQMTEKDWFGIGAYTRYGMVSGFQPGTWAAANNLFAKMNGLSITPVYAHKFDKKWSAAVGAEISYVGLEMNKDFTKYKQTAYGLEQQAKAGYVDKNLGTAEEFDALDPKVKAGILATGVKEQMKDILGPDKAAAVGKAAGDSYLAAKNVGDAKQLHLKGDSFALGWNAAVNYTFDDKNEFGLVYRSKIKHSLEADLVFYGGGNKGDAYGVVTLPDQWTLGYGHKFDNKNRLEISATRTNWHTYDALNMMFSGTGVMDGYQQNPKHYRDTWRYAIGYEHKFSDKYTGMLGFSWDDHAIPYDGGDFIVPTGLRRTYSLGLQYHDKKQTVAVAYAHEQIGNLSFKYNDDASVNTHGNYAKIISIGYSYKF